MPVIKHINIAVKKITDDQRWESHAIYTTGAHYKVVERHLQNSLIRKNNFNFDHSIFWFNEILLIMYCTRDVYTFLENFGAI